MNKKTVGFSGFVMLFIAFFVLPSTLLADKNTRDSRIALSDNELRWRIDRLVGPIDYRFTTKVKSEVEAYILDYPRGSEELLGRITIYFPLFEQKLRERNLPEEIKYLSVIESSLRVDAYSRVGAAGLWQFMRGTAREYGLTVNKSYDQRYSVEESTEAALNYLSVLYDQFGDWTLALAAYNCGPGNVRKAIRKSGKNDYWSIRNYLPLETQNYIPKFVAASYLMAYYYEHDLIPVRPDTYYFETAESLVFRHLSFDEIARVTGTSLNIIRDLNPSYRKQFIPANTNGMKIVLPQQAMYELVASRMDDKIQILPGNKININQYILANFRPEVARLLLLNPGGQMNIGSLPVKDVAEFKNMSSGNENTTLGEKFISLFSGNREQESKSYLFHRLRSGETLTDVANQYAGVDLESLIRNNDIRLDQSPPAGTLLRIMEK